MYSVFFPLFASPGWAYRRLSLPSFYPIAYSMWLRLLAYRCRFRRRGLISSCCSVLRFLLACGSSRLCRLISSVIVSPVRLPAPRHGWRGVGRGVSAFSSCLISVMRSVPISIAGLCRFLYGVSSVCLPVGSAAGGGKRCSHLFVRDVLRCPACPSARLVSRLVLRLVGRAGSCVSRPVLRHGGRGVGGCGATAACFRSSS